MSKDLPSGAFMNFNRYCRGGRLEVFILDMSSESGRREISMVENVGICQVPSLS